MDSQTQKTEVVSINALYRGGKSLMHLQRGPEDAQTVLVEVEKLKTSRFQKRVVTPDRVKQLAETIRNNGLLQPVTARQVGENLELIAGHRRREAFRLLLGEATTAEEKAKWARIPCIIRMGLTDVQAAALAAVENLERDDGDPLEQGLSLLEVKKVGGFANNVQVAEATGMSAQRVTRLVRLAESPEVIQQAVTPGVLAEVADRDGLVRKERRKLELTVALAAYGLYKHVERTKGQEQAQQRTEKLLARAAAGRWTRTQVEAEVKRLTGGRFGTATDEQESEPGEKGTTEGRPAPDGAEEAPRRMLYRDRGNQWVLFTGNIARAEPEELHRLLERLRGFVGEVEAQLASSHR